MELSELVRQKFESIDYPIIPDIKITPNFAGSEERFKIFVKPSTYTDDTTLVNSVILFEYVPSKKEISGVYLLFQERLRGKGFGRKTVTAIEAIAKELECKSICLDGLNLDAGFWRKMDYVDPGNGLEKSIQ